MADRPDLHLADQLRTDGPPPDPAAAGRAKVPRRKAAVVTCMDARLDVLGRLGLDLGDAHVIRNAGALVTDDVVRSLTLSQRVLDTTEVLVVGHTDCGLEGLDDDAFLAALADDAGVRPPWRPGGFEAVAQAVADAVDTLAACPFLPARHSISGFVYDVADGTLAEVAR